MSGEIRKASWLELFYDLIFVVAIARAVHTLGHAHDGHLAAETLAKYVLIMVPLWWAWTGHTLFANRFDCDDGLQRGLTLAQMASAVSMSVFIDVDFDAHYRGFLLSYAAHRGILLLMYARAAAIDASGRPVATYLGTGFALGLGITLSSLAFDGITRYVVLYLGIAVDMLVPLVGRRRLSRRPVEGHHLPERFGLLTIILLGESVTSLVSTLVGVPASPRAAAAAIAGFALTASIWWIYFENLEERIYGRSLGTGQAVIYLHLAIYVALGGIANAIRYAIDPTLALPDYRLLAGVSTLGFVISLQLLHRIYHPREERAALMRNAALSSLLLLAVLFLAPTILTILVAMAVVFVGHAAGDAWRRRAR